MAINPQEDADEIGIEVPEESGEENTALLPTEFFQGKELKPGTICKVKIVQVLDGQAQVAYVPHKEESEPSPGEEPEEPDDAEMSEYMSY